MYDGLMVCIYSRDTRTIKDTLDNDSYGCVVHIFVSHAHCLALPLSLSRVCPFSLPSVPSTPPYLNSDCKKGFTRKPPQEKAD